MVSWAVSCGICQTRPLPHHSPSARQSHSPHPLPRPARHLSSYRRSGLQPQQRPRRPGRSSAVLPRCAEEGTALLASAGMVAARCCIVNAHKLWDLEHSTKTKILDYREALLQQIAAAYPSPHTPVQPTVQAVAQRGFVGHWPELHTTDGECPQCSRGRKRRRRTRYRCGVCGVHLHPNNCFGVYHDHHEIDNRTL